MYKYADADADLPSGEEYDLEREKKIRDWYDRTKSAVA
jgi:hypothetical protein